MIVTERIPGTWNAARVSSSVIRERFIVTSKSSGGLGFRDEPTNKCCHRCLDRLCASALSPELPASCGTERVHLSLSPSLAPEASEFRREKLAFLSIFSPFTVRSRLTFGVNTATHISAIIISVVHSGMYFRATACDVRCRRRRRTTTGEQHHAEYPREFNDWHRKGTPPSYTPRYIIHIR